MTREKIDFYWLLTFLVTIFLLCGCCVFYPQAEALYKIKKLEQQGRYREAYELRESLHKEKKADMIITTDGEYQRYKKGYPDEELIIEER